MAAPRHGGLGKFGGVDWRNITIRITDEENQQLKRICAQSGTSPAETVRNLVRQYIRANTDAGVGNEAQRS